MIQVSRCPSEHTLAPGSGALSPTVMGVGCKHHGHGGVREAGMLAWMSPSRPLPVCRAAFLRSLMSAVLMGLVRLIAQKPISVQAGKSAGWSCPRVLE